MEKVEERLSITVENQGQKIFGVLHLPLNCDKSAPVVLICHGLAGHKAGKHRVYVDLAYRLARRGIASFRFDYRGCGDSEGEFHEVTPNSHYSDSEVCLDYLSNHPSIDSERIGVFGRSFGGPVAVRAATMTKSVRSVALWCPMYSGEQWLDQWQLVQSGAVDESITKEMMQVDSQQGSFEFFNQFFGINVSSDLKKLQSIPLLHIHGEIDSRVDLSHAKGYETCRGDAQGKSKFIKLPNTDHDFSNIDERVNALEETTNWFSETLLV
ncbi:MAG: alpha/beta fold hydrolase [Chlamydiota bacterium]|nr:alpha/beta fold hydrolase [Chlamydiota bacterium]